MIKNKKSGSFSLKKNEPNTLTTLRKNNRRMLINKTACFSLFFSLVGNSISEIPINQSGKSDTVSNDVNHVVMELRKVNRIQEIVEIPEIEEEIPDYTNDIYEFIENEHLSLDSFILLLDSMVDGPFGELYPDRESAMIDLINGTIGYELKYLIIMAREGNTYDEVDYMCAGITGEATGGGNCYDDAYAVASTLINRSHTAWYVNNYGQNFYTLFKAPGQYEIEISGNYLKYLGAIHLPGYQAAIDALYTRESIHSWLQFRANWVELTCKYETFAPRGNKFINKMKENDYVPYPEEEIELLDVKEYVLTNINF